MSMSILYHNKKIEINDACDLKLTQMSSSGIYTVIYNDKLYVVKNNTNTDEATVSAAVMKNIEDNESVKFLFVDMDLITKCQNGNFLYFMNPIQLPELRYITVLLNQQWRYILLLQSLVTIYILNYKIGYYHNDLYTSNSVRNMMISESNITTPIKFANIVIPVKPYHVKMIDFGWSSVEPGFMTTEYHKLYFSDTKHISEIAIFIYVYFKKYNMKYAEKIRRRIIALAGKIDDGPRFDLSLIHMINNEYKRKTKK